MHLPQHWSKISIPLQVVRRRAGASVRLYEGFQIGAMIDDTRAQHDALTVKDGGKRRARDLIGVN